MAHFAELDENSIVLRVTVVDDAHEADGENWCRKFFGTDRWKQTSYNSKSNVHYAPNSHISDDGIALRKNYAGIGSVYDPVLDAFISRKIHNSWILNTDICVYEPPIPFPDDGNSYLWNESTGSWDAI